MFILSFNSDENKMHCEEEALEKQNTIVTFLLLGLLHPGVHESTFKEQVSYLKPPFISVLSALTTKSQLCFYSLGR